MGTRGGSAERSGARGRPSAQDALQAPRMAQEALGVRDEPLCPSPRPEAVLSDLAVSSDGRRRAKEHRRGPVDVAYPEPIDGSAGCSPICSEQERVKSGSPNHTANQVWKPPALSLPERHPFDETRIDDKARWTAACARYLGLVERLCRKYRREFPAAKYGASAMGGLRERLALLQQFGGVPKSVLSLNSVPAEQLEEAVEAFAECFGLTGDAATGHLEGTPSATHLDPAPLDAGTLEVPW